MIQAQHSPGLLLTHTQTLVEASLATFSACLRFLLIVCCHDSYSFSRIYSLLLASLSRDLQSEDSVPHQLHSLQKQNSSILCLADASTYIFAGNQDNEILVST